MDLLILRRSAAEMAAAAVYELYPDVELQGGGETATGFFYEFAIPHPIQLEVIEERMRQIVRERRPVRTLEMVPFSAAELLKKEGHVARLEALGEGLVELIQIGETFHDVSEGPHVKNTAELAAFKISLEPLPDRGWRLVGWCHVSKDRLKDYLKQVARYKEPQQIGEERGLWKGAIWFPEGLKLRQKLIDFLRKEWFADAFEIGGTEEKGRTEAHRSLGREKVAEVISVTPRQTRVQVSFFDKPESEVISSLQSIAKTLTILGFDHSTASKGRVTDYVVEDGVGRVHPIVQGIKIPKKGSSKLDFVFTAEVEKMIDLLLEKNLLVNVENK